MFFAEPSIEINNNQRTLSSDFEMKADAGTGNPPKISTNTDSQSQNSRKRKMSQFSYNQGMQKYE